MLPPITTRQRWGRGRQRDGKVQTPTPEWPLGTSYPLLDGQGYRHHHQNCCMPAPEPHPRNTPNYEIIKIIISDIIS